MHEERRHYVVFGVLLEQVPEHGVFEFIVASDARDDLRDVRVVIEYVLLNTLLLCYFYYFGKCIESLPL